MLYDKGIFDVFCNKYRVSEQYLKHKDESRSKQMGRKQQWSKNSTIYQIWFTKYLGKSYFKSWS